MQTKKNPDNLKQARKSEAEGQKNRTNRKQIIKWWI